MTTLAVGAAHAPLPVATVEGMDPKIDRRGGAPSSGGGGCARETNRRRGTGDDSTAAAVPCARIHSPFLHRFVVFAFCFSPSSPNLHLERASRSSPAQSLSPTTSGSLPLSAFGTRAHPLILSIDQTAHCRSDPHCLYIGHTLSTLFKQTHHHVAHFYCCCRPRRRCTRRLGSGLHGLRG